MTQTGSPYREDGVERKIQPSSNKREAYVNSKLRAQFAVDKAEAWIKAQKEARFPDAERWNGILTSIFLVEVPSSELLRRFGKKMSREEAEKAGGVVGILDFEKVEIYGVPALRFVVEKKSPQIIHAINDETYRLGDVYYKNLIVHTLLRAWQDQDSDLWEGARKILCEPYEKAIDEAAQTLREGYDGATIIGPIYTPPGDWKRGPLKIKRVVVWISPSIKPISAVKYDGSDFTPDSFNDQGVERRPYPGLSPAALLYGSDGVVFKSRMLEAVIRDFSNGGCHMCILALPGEEILFADKACLTGPPPENGEQLL
ncbi:MAG: hypothetical protein WC641_01405 [Patescibacteria group bacterium]